MLTARDGAHLAWLLFLAALTPAVCEELVFRGVVLQALRERWPAARAIATSALFFGVLHVFGGALVRLLPTTLIGAVLAYVAWATRSVVPSMLVHFLNNAMLLALLADPMLRARYGAAPTAPPLLMLALAPLLVWAGVRLLVPRAAAVGRPEPADERAG